jgi:excisionase family DNA binding protein
MSDERALFVRLPAAAADKLDRAAFELKVPKKELVAALVDEHVDAAGRRVVVEMGEDGLTVGRADVRPAAAPEVLTLSDLSALLQVSEGELAALAEAGELPGRRLGDHWRFSRAAVLAWLGERG